MRLYYILSLSSAFTFVWSLQNFAEGPSGLVKIDGLREPEDLREPFIIPAPNFLISFERDGPLIKGSRDSLTAVNFFTALNFWFVLYQDKMNREAFDGQMTQFYYPKCFPQIRKKLKKLLPETYICYSTHATNVAFFGTNEVEEK